MKRRKFSREFKLEAVNLVRDRGVSINALLLLASLAIVGIAAAWASRGNLANSSR